MFELPPPSHFISHWLSESSFSASHGGIHHKPLFRNNFPFNKNSGLPSLKLTVSVRTWKSGPTCPKRKGKLRLPTIHFQVQTVTRWWLNQPLLKNYDRQNWIISLKLSGGNSKFYFLFELPPTQFFWKKTYYWVDKFIFCREATMGVWVPAHLKPSIFSRLRAPATPTSVRRRNRN